MCIRDSNIIVRKQWTEHERLRYPLTIMPTEIIRDTTKLFSIKLIWLGFGIAFGIELINGLNYLNPALPAIKVKSMVRFRGLPWSNAGQIPIGIYPFAIGLGYLIPLDLSFSLSCFYIVWRMQRVILKAFGLNSTRWLTHTMRGGAWIAIGAIALWTCRRHIISILGVFFSRKEENKLYNFAIIGTVIEGLSSEGSVTPRGLANILDKVTDNDVNVIFGELNMFDRIARAISEDTGIVVKRLYSEDYDPSGDGPDTVSYTHLTLPTILLV